MADEVTDQIDEPEKDEKEGKQPADSNLKGELERRKEAQKKAERELAELRDKILEFEDRDKSELQKAQERATRAETQLQGLAGKVTALEKGAWVRSAAAEFNFHDPEDAVVNLREQLGDLEDKRDARRAVERLAKSKAHLIREEKKSARPSIGQVLNNGQPQSETGQQPQQMTAAQLAAKQDLELAEGLAEKLGEFHRNWSTFGGS